MFFNNFDTVDSTRNLLKNPYSYMAGILSILLCLLLPRFIGIIVIGYNLLKEPVLPNPWDDDLEIYHGEHDEESFLL